MTPSVAVVCTTIGDGSLLKHYAKALEGADARMYLIPDRKTPPAFYDAVAERAKAGLELLCAAPAQQEEWLASIGAPDGFFPWNTDHRRNVGYLMAYESGADIIISVDDDNLPQDGWLEQHLDGISGAAHHRGAAGGLFWNPLDQMICKGLGRPWPRGFPYAHREQGTVLLLEDDPLSDVAINAGLWSGEPDVDAITRLALHPESRGIINSVTLAPDTWAPVNSQNTAIRREVLPAYYFFRSPRFGDIYQGYLAQACAKHLGQTVRFGTPVVRHERNDHNLLNDLRLELNDIMVLDSWLDGLTSAKPEGSTYAEVYESLAASLEYDDPDSAMPGQMRTWLQLCARVAP